MADLLSDLLRAQYSAYVSFINLLVRVIRATWMIQDPDWLPVPLY